MLRLKPIHPRGCRVKQQTNKQTVSGGFLKVCVAIEGLERGYDLKLDMKKSTWLHYSQSAGSSPVKARRRQVLNDRLSCYFCSNLYEVINMSNRRNLLPRPDLGTRTAAAWRPRGASPSASSTCWAQWELRAHNTLEVTQFLHQCQNVSASKWDVESEQLSCDFQTEGVPLKQWCSFANTGRSWYGEESLPSCPQPCKWKIELSVIFENTNLTDE